MQLKSADLYYGTRRSPITITGVDSLPTGTLDAATLANVCAQIARATGCLSTEAVVNRIKHHVAVEELRMPIEGRDDLVIPATTQLLGDGFSIIWSH